MPKAKTTTHGLKSLTYEGNRIWNSLPVHMKGAESLGIFKDRISKWQPMFLNRFQWYIKFFYSSCSYQTVTLLYEFYCYMVFLLPLVTLSLKLMFIVFKTNVK